MKIKWTLIALLSIFISVVANAANKDLEKDITMVSYEQSWRDSKGTLALKNNTSEDIKNVVFLITYLDMSGNELDYEEFTNLVNIAPGMTRKVDISAYEHDRSYHYYKSEGLYDNTSFKIKFKLKDYNVEKAVEESTDNDPFDRYDNDCSTDSGYSIMFSLLPLLLLLFFIIITIGLYVLVAVMAQKLNRSVVIWILLSLLATPLLIIIILLVIGKNEDYINNHYDRR